MCGGEHAGVNDAQKQRDPAQRRTTPRTAGFCGACGAARLGGDSFCRYCGKKYE
jgi:hypothetical protein